MMGLPKTPITTIMTKQHLNPADPQSKLSLQQNSIISDVVLQ